MQPQSELQSAELTSAVTLCGCSADSHTLSVAVVVDPVRSQTTIFRAQARKSYWVPEPKMRGFARPRAPSICYRRGAVGAGIAAYPAMRERVNTELVLTCVAVFRPKPLITQGV